MMEKEAFSEFNFGSVEGGSMGSTKFEGAIGTRWTFTASGPITNLASRIGAFATNGAIYIGETTARRLSDEFKRRELGPQHFKNVEQPINVYEILDSFQFAPPLAATS